MSDREHRLDPELERLLAEAAAEEAAVMGEAEALQDAPGLERVDAILEAEWGAMRPRRLRPLAVAAAALIVVVSALFFTLRSPDEATPDEPFLLGSEIALESPLEVPRYGEVRWSGPAGATYVVRVLAPGAQPGAPALYGPTETREGRLALPSASSAWPDRIVLEVEALGPGGTPLATASWHIARRP